MKEKLILAIFMTVINSAYSQVGVNTSTPASTMDITAQNATGTSTNVDGLLVPRIDRQRAQSMTTVPISTLIYVNSISTGSQDDTAANIDTVGYYYFNGTIWTKLNAGGPGITIYNADGILTGNRTVTQGSSTLTFTGTAVNAFSVDNSTLSIDATNHRVGIGTLSPQRNLHVNANSSPLRFENLSIVPTGTSTQGLIIDINGDIYKNNSPSVEGQILRIGINGTSYGVTSESALRFNSNDSAIKMGNAPNGSPNFINTIIDATITDGVAVAAGQGTPARTTDQIRLQPGV